MLILTTAHLDITFDHSFFFWSLLLVCLCVFQEVNLHACEDWVKAS